MKRELKSNDLRVLDMQMSLSYLQPSNRMRTFVKPPERALCMPILHELNYAFTRNSATENLFIGAVTLLSSSRSNCGLVLLMISQRILTTDVSL